MKSLGKAVAVTALFATTLLGSISATVDATRVTMGETVTYSITASGQNVEKPSITELCGQKVLSTSQGTSMQMIGGSFTKEYRFAYTFEPLKDCRIDAVTLKIDGKEERTEPIDIRVVPMQITKDSPFILEMRSQKQQVHVGEPFNVVITFKQRRGSEVVDSKFEPPQLKNLWLKEEEQGRRFEEGDYSVIRVTYVLAAQKSGKLSIDPAQIKIATRSASRDVWGQWLPQLKWRSYFSNPVEVEALPLPDNVSLVGDFAITAEADKHEIDANEAVNVTLRVNGSGNFEDIGSLKPHIQGVSVFADEPEVKGYVENGSYKGSWTQKLAFVSERGFSVPSFELHYFDPKTKSVKTVRTEPIDVKVRNEAPRQATPLKIERAEPKQQESKTAAFTKGSWELPFGAGVLVGVLVGAGIVLVPWGQRRKAKRSERIDPKDHKAALAQLLPYRGDAEVDAMVNLLESSLYGGEANSIDGKQLKALLRRMKGAA